MFTYKIVRVSPVNPQTGVMVNISVFKDGEPVAFAPFSAEGVTAESLQLKAEEFMADLEKRVASDEAKVAELNLEAAELDTVLAPVLDKEFEIKAGAHVEVVKLAPVVDAPVEEIPA
jgi:hypothetical protein